MTDSGGIVFNVGVEIVRAGGGGRIISRDDPDVAFRRAADDAIEWWADKSAAAIERGDDPPDTCALDVAERGPLMLDEIGVIMNITRERVRQIESKGLDDLRQRSRRIRRRLGADEE